MSSSHPTTHPHPLAQGPPGSTKLTVPFKQRVFEKLIAMATIRNLKIDSSKVNELGLTMESVRDTMALLVREHYVNRFNRDGRSYEVIQQVPVTPQTLAQYYVTTPSGQQVPLSNPVTYEIGD